MERSVAVVSHQQGVDTAIDAAIGWLKSNQKPEGFWVGMLESNACIEAEWLLAFHFLGLRDDPKVPGLIEGILHRQRDDGAWEVYYDAPFGDINATVECYVALRAYGYDKDSPALAKARAWILGHGGLSGIRVFTRYWLALFGEWPWHRTPNLPPAVIFNPKWFPFNIYNFSSWARATLLPLAILSARRPVKPLPCGPLDELYPGGRDRFDFSLPKKGRVFSLERLLLISDRLLHGFHSIGLTPAREKAIRCIIDWIVVHQDEDGAWGGIQPPWIYSLMALHEEGYALDHPVIAKGLDALNQHWQYERDGALHIQASESPVWDTLLVLLALLDCGMDVHQNPSMQRALRWILDMQIDASGDWQVKVPHVEPGGWAFERANTWYPDVDDTGVALVVLARLRNGGFEEKRIANALRRAKNWVSAMQCKNGGWAAFDKDNDKPILTKIPFCDFGEALDPPSVDVTAHVLEAYGLLGIRDDEAVRKALAYVKLEQESDGSWFGRWGVNHIYGTAAVLPALAALGEDMNAEYVRRAADWMIAHQNDDGGWGESCASYMDPAMRGRGDSTASQTGWALMALLAIGSPDHRGSIEKGVGFLVATQRDDGTWDEPQFTGTGFPGYGVGERIELDDDSLGGRLRQGAELARGFMINYNLYRHYFPLMALGRARSYLNRDI